MRANLGNKSSDRRTARRASRYELRLEAKIKNNVLWNAIHDKFPSVAAFCRAYPELRRHYHDICALLRFKEHPLVSNRGKHGKYYTSEYRKVCLQLEIVLGVIVEDLFPRHLYDRLVEVATEYVAEYKVFSDLPRDVNSEIRSLPSPAEEMPEVNVDQILLRERFSQVLRTLSYREREIIKHRFGLFDAQMLTIQELASIFGVGRERIRQIEAQAIRKLMQPSRAEQLAEFCD